MLDAQTLALLDPAISKLVSQECRADSEHERAVQLAKSRRNQLYYRGFQHLYPVVRMGTGVVDWQTVPGTALSRDNTTDGSSRAYDYVINEMRGLVDKVVAILAQRAPNMKAQADRKDDDAALRRARKADTMATTLRSNWNIDLAVQDLAYGLSLDGTMFIYTPYVANPQRYGVRREPIIGLAEKPVEEPYFECVQCGARPTVSEAADGVCPSCGAPLGEADLREPEIAQVPEVLGEKEYPNGCVEMYICDITTVTTPVWVPDLEHCPWLDYSYETYRGSIFSLYRNNEAATKILKELAQPARPMGPNVETSRLAREASASPLGTTLTKTNSRWTFSRLWLTPDVYESINDESDPDGQIRATLAKIAPEGAKITRVNDRLIDIEPERITEVWAAVKPRPSKALYADPLFEDFIGIQDIVNDIHALMKEMGDRNIPFTLFNSQIFDPKVLKQHRATPMEFIPVLPQAGTQMRDMLWNSPTVDLNPQIANWGASLLQSGQNIVGAMPSAWGGGDGVEKTARQAEMDRNQALLQLGLPWNRIRDGLCRAHENAVIQQAKWGNGQIVQARRQSMGPTVIEIADMEDVMAGGWHFKAEEAFPMTWGQRRDNWRDLLDKATTDPTGMIDRIIGFSDPENSETAQEAFGMPGWNNPMLNAVNKIRDTIRQLSDQAPMEDVDPMSGQVVGLKPSIPPDEFEDDHELVAKVVRNWAQTEKALELRRENPDGYANVIAWAKAHLAIIPPPPMPGGGPGGPAGPPPPEGKPEQGPEGAPPPAPPVEATAQPDAAPAPAQDVPPMAA